jgi:hypothetical protein
MGLRAVGVFCEDIREEKGGQITIVGILPDNVNTPPRPEDASPTARVVLPKLGLYLRILMETEDNVEPITVKLLLPEGEEIVLGEVDATLIARSKKEAADRGLPIAGIVNQALMQGFRAPIGTIYAAIEAGGQRHICAVLNLVPQEQA